MADTSQLTLALASYARERPENLANLRAMRDQAVNDLAEGKGAQITGGTGSGLNFSMSPTTTIADWFKAIQAALDLVGGGRRVTVTRVMF